MIGSVLDAFNEKGNPSSVKVKFEGHLDSEILIQVANQFKNIPCIIQTPHIKDEVRLAQCDRCIELLSRL